MSSPATGTPPTVAALYHRPIDGTLHGGSLHFKGFVERLRRTVVVLPVAPPCLPADESLAKSQDQYPLLLGFRYLLSSTWNAFRFLLSDGLGPPNKSVKAIIAFDIYLAGIAALWAKIRRIPLIYYPQDSNVAVAADWKQARYRGGRLFQAVRSPLERLGLGSASLVLVVSPGMRHELEARGLEPGRIRVCPLKRLLPEFRPDSVAQWRERLALVDKVAVVFLGSFEYAPNVRAFRYIQSQLAPKLAQLDPRIQVLVAGVGSEAYTTFQASNLRVLGTVNDLDGLLYASQIGVAPMDVAGGTSGKIVDYVLHGLTVVATPQAAQGVEASSSLVVVPLEGFPQRIARLSQTLGPRAGHGRRELEPAYVSRYVDSEDIRAVALEISRLAAGQY